MTLQKEIDDVARNFVTKQKILFNRPRTRVRTQAILEFLKWLSFFTGVIGILGLWVASDRFIIWIGTINPIWLRSILEVFSYKIVGDFTFATIAFTGALILGCILATLQKRTEVVFRARADEATSMMSELTTDVNTSKKVLNELGDFKNILSETCLDFNAAKDKLLKEAEKKKQLNLSLKEARDTIFGLESKVKELTKEKERLNERLKLFQREFNLLEINGIGPKTLKKLRKVGILKTSDLLKIAPEVLSDKTGISSKLIARWFEDAAKLSSGNT